MIPGYSITRELSTGFNKKLYLGKRESDGKNFLIKEWTIKNSTDKHLLNEFSLLKNPVCDHCPKIENYITTNESSIVILDVAYPLLLSDIIKDSKKDWEASSKLFHKILTGVNKIHDSGFVHNDIDPANIVFNPVTKEIQIIDFSYCINTGDKNFEDLKKQFLNKNLNYISPEQTGKINKEIDHRSDLYSLGVLFYQLLTGKLPFEFKDPLEIIYAHVALKPVAPIEINNSLPEILSRVVLKLLEKIPEDRYQSAAGVLFDLNKIISSKGKKQKLDFPLGMNDVSDRFEITNKLYGRDLEIKKLLNSFSTIARGEKELLLVSGYSGIGKTSLINEIQKPILKSGGKFISGKFDQLNMQLPYSAMIQAFQQMIRIILAESDTDVEMIKVKLITALGNNAQVIIDVIPELELIIGKQQAVPELGPTESQNRFNLYFQKFIQVFAQKDHPLVIFLDDLQWADSASLRLINILTTDPNTKYFLLIGAYRDNEVSEDHPLLKTVSEIQSEHTKIETIVLKPLDIRNINKLVSDSLRLENKVTQRLSDVVFNKTEGNPFFLKFFLKTLYEDKLLYYTPQQTQKNKKSGWQWDMEKIEHLHSTANVIDLVIKGINKIPKQTRELLRYACCLGNTFSSRELSLILQLSMDDINKEIMPAIDRGLVLSESNLTDLKNLRLKKYDNKIYKFLHDRVQQAAYSLITEKEKPRLHYEIGDILLKNFAESELQEKLFDVVNHLNVGKDFTNGKEKIKLASLNLEAGRKAKSSTAYRTALSYFTEGINLLDPGSWTSNYELNYNLYKELAETEYLCGNFNNANKYFEITLQNSRTSIDKAEVYKLQIIQYENTAQYLHAVETGVKALKLFDIKLPDTVEEKQAAIKTEMEEIAEKLEKISIVNMIDLPVMSDANMKMAMKLLMTLWAPAYIAGDPNLPVLISASMVNLSLEYGNTEESAYGYVTHGITVGTGLGDYKSGFEFGKLALSVNEKFNDRKYRSKVQHMFSCFVNLWRMPIKSCFVYSKEAFKSGLETGDFVYATYASFHESWYALIGGMELSKFRTDYENNINFLVQIKNFSFADAQRIILNWGAAFEGLTKENTSLSKGDFSEDKYPEMYNDILFFETFFYVAKTSLCYSFGEHEKANEYAERAEKVVPALIGTIWDAVLSFYYALNLVALNSSGNNNKLQELSKKLKTWADNSPENFHVYSTLVEAEIFRINKDVINAEKFYKEAINYSSGKNIYLEALSYELYGKFLLETGDSENAGNTFVKSVFLYSNWGAKAKVKQIETEFANLFKGVKEKSYMDNTIAVGTGNLSISNQSNLDLMSIVKAAQAISKEVVPEKVTERLMHIAMTNIGAQKGILVLKKGGALFVETVCTVDRDGIKTKEFSDEENELINSSSIIKYVNRTQETLLLPNVNKDGRFTSDNYYKKYNPKSVICVPIIYQNELTGILYLENSLFSNSFSSERIEIINILASQTAISLANAKLLQEKNTEISERIKTENILRSMTENTASVTGADFFQSLVKNLTTTLGIRFAFVTECKDTSRLQVRTLAYAENDQLKENYEYETEGTPCKIVMEGNDFYTERNLEKFFPKEKGFSSYLGVPIYDHFGDVIGHIAVFDKVPFEKKDRNLDLLKIFAARAGAEIERKMALEKLQAAHNDLEKRIEDRTAELMASYKKLEDEIAEKTSIELSLENARDAAEAANRAKTEFLANMSHELRTPLNGILGYTQILKRDKSLVDGQIKAIDIIHRSAEHLLTLINDILDLSKIEAQKIELQESEFNFVDFLNHITDMIKIRTEQKGLFFNIETHGAIPETVKCDEKRLRQILINLLGNAVKFTDRGGVVLKLLSENIGENKFDITFEIIDTGIGIAEEYFEEIYLPFKQVSVSEKYEGTGLGLAVTQNLVNIMGGSINVKSELGKGSTFTVVLNIKSSGRNSQKLADSYSEVIGYRGKVKSILIADDKWENRSVLVNMLLPIGFEIYEAVNGKDAIEKAEMYKPDLVLMDLVMPVLDGFAAAKHIRENPSLSGTHIIALSASVFEYNKLKSKEAGCDGFIPKPVSADELLQAVKNCLRIKWTYRTHKDIKVKEAVPPGKKKEFASGLPAKKVIDEIYNFASIGDISGIKNIISELKNNDHNHSDFVRELEIFVAEFEMTKIKDFIKPFLETSK